MNFNSSVAAEGYGELILLANKIKKQKNERKKKKIDVASGGGGLKFFSQQIFLFKCLWNCPPPSHTFPVPHLLRACTNYGDF